ncbi:MAG: hypothetical protein E3K37_11920 [Candidatus Kuenenia sp.]|nr:hypothetical protein [Candidatus Kuenenia hertensis]
MLVLIIGIKSYREKVYISNKYLTKYILLHYPVVFFAGVIYNIIIYVYLCIIVSNDDMKQVSTLPLLTIWSASLAMWMGPFIWAWIQTFSKDFIDEYYRKTTFQIIANLNNHQVMLGYGELGKGIQTELLERMKKNKIQKEPILDPSDGSTIRYLAKDMVVVDRDDKIFDHVYCDPSFEKIGIAKAKYRYIKSLPQTRLEIKKEELWIPAVIGNFINESIIDYCALGKCKFFIDTIEGYEESIRISKFAHDQQRTRGIITVSDSAQKKFLFPRHSGHGIFLAYPTRQRGISLAEVIYPAMSRWLNERNVPNVLIFTDNLRQIHYIIETILQELKLSNYLDQYLGGPWRTLPYQNEHVDLRITLCSEAEEVIRVCCTNMKEDILHSLDVREWVEIIERCASPECAWPSVKYYIKSRVIVEKPHLMTMENMIKWLKPKVVVINYKKTADILKVLHDWIIAVERHNSLKEYYRPWIWMPKIIVGYQGEEERDVRDWLTYYDTLCSIKCSGGDSYNWQRYPVQSIDCMVDLNKDSREQIAAIAEAMQNKR